MITIFFSNLSRPHSFASYVTLDFIKIAKVDCIVPTNFYTKLLVMTLGPIMLSLLLALVSSILVATSTTRSAKRNVVENASTVFLTLTYIIFASVSTTVLETFNCRTYGDGECV